MILRKASDLRLGDKVKLYADDYAYAKYAKWTVYDFDPNLDSLSHTFTFDHYGYQETLTLFPDDMVELVI